MEQHVIYEGNMKGMTLDMTYYKRYFPARTWNRNYIWTGPRRSSSAQYYIGPISNIYVDLRRETGPVDTWTSILQTGNTASIGGIAVPWMAGISTCGLELTGSLLRLPSEDDEATPQANTHSMTDFLFNSNGCTLASYAVTPIWPSNIVTEDMSWKNRNDVLDLC
ncbi:hypothetical protein GLOTRDRAFT_96855 [Gloeophyllum trabeum ATCC 11539]|uniref:Uncharacterized protein n=1 Tax=Gloeophyllum trabeum (strain ATCC 11539 / FP-39264 / Madison 617) TaxID=670483 RepID=S7RDR5_GLOTA|nr:uncharacterized protein GLOTRDRAFT_96855 [Gloeophyllum trabeum ATCC 11539]EPQ50579.1 hypothetical protein GLOTRDRAFT_96855 [Gloeophyllum trabeum ATCC 11539]